MHPLEWFGLDRPSMSPLTEWTSLVMLACLGLAPQAFARYVLPTEARLLYETLRILSWLVAVPFRPVMKVQQRWAHPAR
jgi:hypothetical protein